MQVDHNRLPNVDDPFFQHVFKIFIITLETLFTTLAPIVLAILAFFAVIIFIIVFIVYLFTALAPKQTPSKSTPSSISDASSSDVDEKKRLEIEIEFLSELMKSRQERLEQLSKSE
ncbi:hypothetical protein N7493_004836 [Penicillium malachiteum]|uniref:Uncharacterized protein n=1 Tax=Penicillium malachiteum TaxID=1324776 RepID=A0AAD6HQA0_9EURO|nr:hypothetical protein N7493_004836 [Penicillium malachiteum]